jgi:hypothetical protein
MITAKNYAAQCEKEITKIAGTLGVIGDWESANNLFLSHIKDAVHFALPDGGKILDDNKKGIKGEKIRLPFNKITVEYYVPQRSDAEYIGEGTHKSSKRLIVARELHQKQIEVEFKRFKHLISDPEDVWIVVTAASYIDDLGLWLPESFGWILPSDWDQTSGEVGFDMRNDADKDYIKLSGLPISVCKNMLDQAFKGQENEQARYKAALRDIGSELLALLELCEALSCSNIKHEVMEYYDAKMNQRRINDGKVPLYETRTLWLDAPGTIVKGNNDGLGGTHRSPRQHLRRGHIRRLQNDKKVWVNSAIVGAKNGGVICSNYAIREAA